MSTVLEIQMPGILSRITQRGEPAKGKGTFAIAPGTQKCVLRMDHVCLMVQVFFSVFVLMASMATSVCARAPSRCLCFSGFWDPPHYPSPSCFGAPNAEKPRLHEPRIGLPTDLKVIPIYRSPARGICFLDSSANRASSRLRPPLEDGKLHNFGV